MATQTDYDRFLLAWQKLQRSVNRTIPDTTDRLWAIRVRIQPTSGGRPPTQS